MRIYRELWSTRLGTAYYARQARKNLGYCREMLRMSLPVFVLSLFLYITCTSHFGFLCVTAVLWPPFFARPCSVGYSQTVPGVFTPGITLQRTFVSSVGQLYPYPELLEDLYDIHTRTRNFWKFCTPVPTIPGVRVQHFYTRSELL